MVKPLARLSVRLLTGIAIVCPGYSWEIATSQGPVQLDVRVVSDSCIRVTLKAMAYEPDFPRNPALVECAYPAPTLSLREIDAPISKQLGSLRVKVTPEPLAVQVSNRAGRLIQQLTFETDGTLSFLFDDHPVLGRGEGGPEPRGQGLADGSFTLYEDDGETLDYLTGECVVTQFDWHDQRAKLVIQRHLPEDANEQASTRLRVELIPDNIVKNVEVVDHLEVPMHE